MKQKLTDRQLEVLVYLQDFLKQEDTLPSQKKLSERFGLKDVSSAYHYFIALKRKGYIERNSVGKWRFVRESV